MAQPLIDQSQIGTIKETAYSLTGTSIDLSNGTIQYKTLTGNTTFTITNMVSGQSLTLMINDGAGYTVTWPAIAWVGGSAPSLATSGYNVIELWQVGSAIYGSYVGAA